MYLRVLLLFALLFCSALTPLTVGAEEDTALNNVSEKSFVQLGKLSLGDDFNADLATSGFGKLIATKYDPDTLRHTVTFKNGQIITQEASSLHPAVIISMKIIESQSAATIFDESGAKTLSGIGIGSPMKKVIAIYGLSKIISTNYQGAIHIYENESDGVRTTFGYDRDNAKVISIQIEELYI